ncbi:MAG: D-alanyl-D-alanine carboxypeptidase [Methylococcales bacterium]|nr:D-alanyl-D-alanine carboxypeptidase [Methylococcales bacterium]
MNTLKSILLILMPIWLLSAPVSGYGQHAAILIDADNGSVLHEVNATHSWYPASLTKVMTLYMTFDALKSGQIHLYDTLRTSYHASRQPNSKLGLRQGETLTVQDAVLAVITRSANDAAVVLAEHLGGTEESFAVKMTTKAHDLGMYDSHFMNATGLPHQWQVTTPRDLAILAWKVQRNFPEYYPFFSAHNFNYKGRELRGINKFTASYPGAEGMKTGFTCGSGYNLISVASQNGKRLIGVIMGGMTSAERYHLMINMMNDGFANSSIPYSSKNITTMTSTSAGTPPYQLGCGNLAHTTIGANDTDNDHPKFTSTSKRKGKNLHTTKKHKSVKNTKSVNKSKSLKKTKPAAKKKPASKAKPSSKSANKAKSSKTRYHHS